MIVIRRTLVAFMVSLLLACDGGTDGDGGAPADGHPGDGAEDGESSPDGPPGDAEQEVVDGEPRGEPGPLSFVVDQAEMVAERICDFDGDGRAENAVADLGSPASGIFAMVLSAGMQGNIEDGYRTVAHFPWLRDAAVPHDPDTRVVLFSGLDTDDPVDGTDDFSGSEPFEIKVTDLNPCGEPVSAFSDASIVDGELEASGDIVPFLLGDETPGRGPRIWGAVEPLGASISFALCAYLEATDLGRQSTDHGDFNALELLVSLGRIMSLSGVEGLSPDVDVDGDGLERFVVDAEGHIESCIDGDLAEIPGRDCSQDDRIVDGISLTIELHAVRARFAGLPVGWEEEVEGECSSPPDPSFWEQW